MKQQPNTDYPIAEEMCLGKKSMLLDNAKAEHKPRSNNVQYSADGLIFKASRHSDSLSWKHNITLVKKKILEEMWKKMYRNTWSKLVTEPKYVTGIQLNYDFGLQILKNVQNIPTDPFSSALPHHWGTCGAARSEKARMLIGDGMTV